MLERCYRWWRQRPIDGSRQRVFGNDGEAFAGVLVGVPVVGVTGELGAGKGADEVGTEGGVVVELEVVGTVAAVVVVDCPGVVDGGTLKGVPSGVVVVVDGCVVEFSGSVVDVDGITSHCSGRLTAGTPVSDGHVALTVSMSAGTATVSPGATVGP